jgi:hypothetical protein
VVHHRTLGAVACVQTIIARLALDVAGIANIAYAAFIGQSF